MAAGGARQQSVEYALSLEIADLKRALTDSLTLLKGNDATVRALAEQLGLLASQQTRVGAATRNTTRATTQATRATRELSEASRGAAFNLKGLAFQVGALVGVFGIADVLRRTALAVYDNARAYDTIRAKIGLVTESSRESADVTDYVRGRANALGVEQRSLIDSYVRLKIASRGSVVEGKATQRVFEGLTTASAALRLSTDETRRAMKAFEQIISKGKLSAEEIRQQLGDVLPGALQLFQEATGKSAREFDKLLAEGKLFIDSGMFQKIGDLLERDYGKGVKLDTIAAQVSLLANAYDDLFQALNNAGAREALAGVLNRATGLLRGLEDALSGARVSGVEFAHAMTTVGTALLGLLAANLLTRLATQLSVVAGAMTATGLASIANVARLLAFRNAIMAVLAPFGGPLGIAAVAAVTFFTTYRNEEQQAIDKTLELEKRTYDLIEVIDLLTQRQAQVKLDAVREELKKTKEEIDKLEKDLPGRKKTAQESSMRLTRFGIEPGQVDDIAAAERALAQARIQFGLMSGEAIRLEGRLAAVSGAAKPLKTDLEELAEASGKAAASFHEENEELLAQLQLRAQGYAADEAAMIAKARLAGIEEVEIGRRLQLSRMTEKLNADEKAAAKAAEDHAKALEKMGESLEKFLESDTLKSLGSTLRDSFNEAGGAVGDLIGRIGDLTKIQKKSAKAHGENAAVNFNNMRKYAEKEREIANLTEREYAATYASMAGAAKSFFTEGSKGYETMLAMERGFRAVELALSIESMYQNNKETINAVANAMVKAVTSGTAGVAKAFEQMGVYGFIGAGAIIAYLASMGVTMSKGGGGVPQVPKTFSDGTGSVLGDSSAQSESLSKSINDLEEIQDAGLEVSRAMLAQLRSIDAAIRGVGAALAQRFAITGTATPFSHFSTFTRENVAGMDVDENAKAMQDSLVNLSTTFRGMDAVADLGGIDWRQYDVGAILVEGVFGNIGAFAESQGVGLAFTSGQKIGAVLTGALLEGMFYQTIRSGDNDIFGSDHNVEIRDVFSTLDLEIRDQFSLVVRGLGQSVLNSVEMIGGDVNAAKALLDTMSLGFDRIDLTGLSAEEVSERLSAVFSKLGDDMALRVLPAMRDFQKIGEGLYQTLSRVAAQTFAVNQAITDIGQSFGAMDFLEKAEGIQEMIDAAGGIDALGGNLTSFVDGFYSDAERLEMVQGQLSRGFASIGKELPTTREAFREMVLGLDLTTASGRMLFTVLTSLSDEMDEYFSLQDAAADAADEVAELARSLRDLLLSIRVSITELQGGDVTIGEFNEALLELLAATASEDIIEAGERLHDAIMARYEVEADAIRTASEAEIDALKAQRSIAQETLKTWEQAQKIIGSITEYLAELQRSPMGLGSPLDRTQIALQQFRDQTALALSGDIDAAGGLQKLAADVLNMARDTFASGGPYSDIFGEITGSLSMVAEALGLTPGGGAQATLDTIDAQIAEASERADALLEALKVETIEKLTSLGEFLQYGNSRLDAMLVALTGGTAPAPMPTFAEGGIATRASIFAEAGPEAAVPLPDGRRIPVELRGNGGDTGEIVSELRKLREAVDEMDQPINLTMQMPDGSTRIVAMTLKQLREKSLRGEKVIYAGGVQ